jgi:hypothetical protein
MAMNFNTTVIGQLARALKGNANQEPSDTKLTIPPVLNNTIQIPEPNASFFQVAQAGAQNKSFMQDDVTLFNFSNSVVLNVLNPGIWQIDWSHAVVPVGAVNDLTSIVNLSLGLIGADFGGGGPVVRLTAFRNTGLIFQVQSGKILIHVNHDQQLQFIRSRNGHEFFQYLVFCFKTSLTLLPFSAEQAALIHRGGFLVSFSRRLFTVIHISTGT